MKIKRDDLTSELDTLLPSSKEWLLANGYITKSTVLGDIEYAWTEKGYALVRGLKEEKGDVQS